QPLSAARWRAQSPAAGCTWSAVGGVAGCSHQLVGGRLRSAAGGARAGLRAGHPGVSVLAAGRADTGTLAVFIDRRGGVWPGQPVAPGIGGGWFRAFQSAGSVCAAGKRSGVDLVAQAASGGERMSGTTARALADDLRQPRIMDEAAVNRLLQRERSPWYVVLLSGLAAWLAALLLLGGTLFTLI